MFSFFKRFKKKSAPKKIVIIVDEDFYPNCKNPHLENPFEETWNGESLIDMISYDKFLTDKDKYYKFYTQIRKEYRKVKSSSRYHLPILSLFNNDDITIINLGIDSCFERAKFKKVLHPKGLNTQLICSPNTFGCGKKFKFEEFNDKIVCKSCKEKKHLKPNIDWFNEAGDFEEWNDSKNSCENADMIIFFGSNCNRTIVNTLLNLNPETIKVEVAPRTSDILETEFHHVVMAQSVPEGLEKLKKLIPIYFKKS